MDASLCAVISARQRDAADRFISSTAGVSIDTLDLAFVYLSLLFEYYNSH